MKTANIKFKEYILLFGNFKSNSCHSNSPQIELGYRLIYGWLQQQQQRKRNKNNNQAALHVGEMSKLNCGNYLPRYAENGPKTQDKRNPTENSK